MNYKAMFDMHGSQMGAMHDLIRSGMEQQAIIRNYENHDCHLSPDDGCTTCEQYHDLMSTLHGKCFNKDGLCESDNCRCR